ncbi:MAG: sugar transferase [Candidatus Pacebacteria bacterium]|nr:sugar transferase [Candidatus Paceibacterota bacterium]
MRYVRHEAAFLLLGDLVCFYAALYTTLAIRYLALPERDLWVQHAIPFTYLFAVAVIVYFIAGLYDQHTVLLRSKLPQLVSYSQVVIVVLAAIFFFSIPYFGITPKTNLVIFLVVSSVFIVCWRLFLTRFIGVRGQQNALVLGSGSEIDDLVTELNANARYGLCVQHHIAPDEVVVSEKLEEQIRRFIVAKRISVIIIDTRDPRVLSFTSVFYDLLFSHPGLSVLSALQLYEEIFRRIPISRLEDAWFIEHITRQPPLVYNMYHRTFDIVASLLLGAVALVFLPFIAFAIWLDDRGPIFFYQRRIGKDNQPLDLVKMRTMTAAQHVGKGGHAGNRVTRVGSVLRKARIDELPQLWNVLRGGYSLIGPRPEIPEYVARYSEAIPYYNARHLITPGLSGWAQLNHHEHPHHGIDIEETRNKLSYDLYYLKHRSFWVDLEIGLKTLKTLVSVVGK